MRRWRHAVIAGGLAGLLAGCAAPAAAPPAGAAGALRVPADLSIDATVMRGRDVLPRARVHLRPTRCILFADGSLHYHVASEGEREAPPLPKRTRQLGRREMAELWALLDEVGWSDPAAGGTPGPLPAAGADPGGFAYVVTIVGEGRRWTIVRAFPDGPPDDDAPTTRVVRALAALAWATDLPAAPVATAPPRYDFGPDPYARYRRP